MATQKKCCPIWAILAVLGTLAALAALAMLLYKKMYSSAGDSYWEEYSGLGTAEAPEDEVPVTTDKDFV